MTADIGTIRSIFNRKYIYTDPQFVQNLGLWRDINVALPPDEIKKITALLPITATESIDGASTNLDFNIMNLPEMGEPAPKKTLLETARNFGRFSLGTRTPELTTLFTVAPVQKLVVDSVDVLYFDISTLDYMPDEVVSFAEKSRRMNTRTRPYNRNRSAGPSLTATEPMVQDTNGSSATVSFDISDLNYA
tara:strand:- start:383 stop:955 length:573 start_codon:yes stop_codon:yes gene_type:complete